MSVTEKSVTYVKLAMPLDTNFVRITRLNTSTVVLYNTINVLQSGMSSTYNIKYNTMEK